MDESSPMTSLEAGKGPRFRLTLSTAILLGMVLGILVGIFFGELVAWLDIIGNAFIRLLQMTILPYILVSLILGIGGLTFEKARLLAVRASGLLLVTWLIAFAFILVMPLGFPNWESASFYSNALVEFPPQPDFLKLYIPANPFESLAENLIPAVVIFALALGVALIGIEDKEPLLEQLRILSHALMSVAGMVVKLTPIGVFAISASAAGTMSVEELSKLQVYLIIFNAGALILAFWVLPMLVAALTPFDYKEVVRISRDALVTSFTTGNLFVVLPVLTEGAKKLFADKKLTTANSEAYVDVIIPVSFNFPNIGKLIMLFFVLFAGWFSGSEMALSAYPSFIFSGLMSFFGGVDVALPFMLDLMHIPTDMYQLYVVTGIVNGRTATLLAAMNLLCFTLLVVASLTGKLKLDWRRIGMLVLTTLGILIGTMLLSRLYFETMVENAYNKDEVVSTMRLLDPHEQPVVFDVMPDLEPDADPSLPAIERIKARSELRVAFVPERMPFCYVNDEAKLVGIEVELMHALAKDLGVTPVFVPSTRDELAELMRSGLVDIAIGGVAQSALSLSEMTFAAPYMDATAALLVRDHDRARFATIEGMREADDISIAVVKSRLNEQLFRRLEASFPNAVVDWIDSTDSFIDDGFGLYDALLTTAERGSSLTLLHPDLSVVVPRPSAVKIPLAMAVTHGDRELADFLSGWLEVMKKGGRFQRIYDHWILGKNATETGPRWSVIRNVLGWVE